jgi:hypothetical protein
VNSRARRLLVSCLGAAALLAAGAYAGAHVTSARDAAARAKPPPPSLVTAELEQRQLSTEIVARGARVPVSGYRVTARAAAGADAVVTSVRARVGDRLAEGAVIADVSGQPLVVAALEFPLYRDLATGDHGPDVTELGRFLERLGLVRAPPASADPSFAAAMRILFAGRGYPALISANAMRFTLSRRWFATIDRAGRRIAKIDTAVGSTLDDPGAVLVECDTTTDVVLAHLDHDGAERVRVGDDATVADDNQDGRLVPMRVAHVGVAAADSADGVPVTLTGTDRVAVEALSQNLTVTIAAAVAKHPVLVAPITAIVTLQDGTSTVERLTGDVGTTVEVTLGPCVSGWCQIVRSDPSLAAGERVVVGRGPRS